MSKAILISIKPKWVAKILNGEKTIEIRKTMPKCKLPIDVYIYCTKDKKYANLVNRGGFLTGMVVAKFTLNEVNAFFSYDETFLEDSCLTSDELEEYADNKNVLYAWHIDNLEIFDKPLKLIRFSTLKSNKGYVVKTYRPVLKAPQSWCYIEV